MGVNSGTKDSEVSENQYEQESVSKTLKLNEKEVSEGKNKENKNEGSSDNLILRVYNVPPDYTISKLQELIEENCSSVQLDKVIPPYPWDDMVDTCWILVCKNRKSYTSLLSLEDIWIKPDKKDKFGGSITFVEGNKLDLIDIPSKSDEQLILNDHLKGSLP